MYLRKWRHEETPTNICGCQAAKSIAIISDKTSNLVENVWFWGWKPRQTTEDCCYGGRSVRKGSSQLLIAIVYLCYNQNTTCAWCLSMKATCTFSRSVLKYWHKLYVLQKLYMVWGVYGKFHARVFDCKWTVGYQNRRSIFMFHINKSCDHVLSFCQLMDVLLPTAYGVWGR